jgi:hypothetical protein
MAVRVGPYNWCKEASRLLPRREASLCPKMFASSVESKPFPAQTIRRTESFHGAAVRDQGNRGRIGRF